MASGSVGIATNWASFSIPPDIEECQEEIYLPLYDFSKVIPSTMTILVTFRAGPQGLAVLVAGSQERLQPILKGTEIPGFLLPTEVQ